MTRDSRCALWLIMAIALVLTAACQGGGTHRPVDRKAQEDPEWWLDSHRVEQDRYIDAVIRKCPAQGFLSNRKCVTATIFESFAEQGSARASCETEDPLGPLLMCMELITASERAYRALGIDPKSVTDWDDPYDAFATVSQLVGKRLTSKCPDPAQGACIAQEVADLFAVPPAEANRCVLSSEVKRQVSCAMALIRIEGYRTALQRVG